MIKLDDKLSKINVALLQKAIQLAENTIKGLAENIVVFLGLSGVGKSTSITTMNGKQMESYPGLDDSPILVAKGHKKQKTKDIQDGKIKGGYIQTGITAGTAVPDYLPLKGTSNRIYLYDLPGFGDNRGNTQILINAYYINRIFDLHKKVTICFTISADFLNSKNKGEKFIESLENILQMLGKVSKFQRSLAFLVTRTRKKFTQKKIIETLEEFLSQSQKIQNNSAMKEFLNLVIKKVIPIIIIPEPRISEDEDQITKSNPVNVTSQYEDFITRARQVFEKLEPTSFQKIQRPSLTLDTLKQCLKFVEQTEKTINGLNIQILTDIRSFLEFPYENITFHNKMDFKQTFTPLKIMKEAFKQIIKLSNEGVGLKQKSELFDKFNQFQKHYLDEKYQFKRQRIDALDKFKNSIIMANFLSIFKLFSKKYTTINAENVIQEFFKNILDQKNAFDYKIISFDEALQKKRQTFIQKLFDEYLQKVPKSQFYESWMKSTKLFPSVWLSLTKFNQFKTSQEFVKTISDMDTNLNIKRSISENGVNELEIMKRLIQEEDQILKTMPNVLFIKSKIYQKINSFNTNTVVKAVDYNNWNVEAIKKNLMYINHKSQDFMHQMVQSETANFEHEKNRLNETINDLRKQLEEYKRNPENSVCCEVM